MSAIWLSINNCRTCSFGDNGAVVVVTVVAKVVVTVVMAVIVVVATVVVWVGVLDGVAQPHNKRQHRKTANIRFIVSLPLKKGAVVDSP